MDIISLQQNISVSTQVSNNQDTLLPKLLNQGTLLKPILTIGLRHQDPAELHETQQWPTLGGGMEQEAEMIFILIILKWTKGCQVSKIVCS